MNPHFLETARMLVQVAPLVLVDDFFALKGGTAINLFLRDMPRLSVDLDLVIRDHTLSRVEALSLTQDALKAAADRLRRLGFESFVVGTNDTEAKLFVRRAKIQIKIEVNFVMRGTVRSATWLPLTPAARSALLADIQLPIASMEDVYGGKLVAAMDRQHPRDLFDVMQLLENEGITPGIRQAFLIYLVSHNRPVHEVLFPKPREIGQEYLNNFEGMTEEPVELRRLLEVRARMMQNLQKGLRANERKFLLSIVRAEPDWQLIDLPHLEVLPGLSWKLHNLKQLREQSTMKFRAQAEMLQARFEE